MLFTDCHPLTGHCLSCMHNTAGPRCESCAPGYYGDAINAKNCTREFGVPRSRDQVWQCRLQVDSACVLSNAGCDCSPCGTESCDPHSGQCRCKPGVTGPLCDRCEVRALSEVTSPQHLSFKHGRHVGSGLEPHEESTVIHAAAPSLEHMNVAQTQKRCCHRVMTERGL